MLSKHIYTLSALILIGVLYFAFDEYTKQKRAFDKQHFVVVTVMNIDCRKRGASHIGINDNGINSFLQLPRNSCDTLVIGQQIKVLVSEDGAYYWNYKPNRLILFCFPFIIGLIGYCIYSAIIVYKTPLSQV